MAADVDGVDDEVSSLQRGTTVGLGTHLGPTPVVIHGQPGHVVGQSQTALVDVVQDQGERTQVVVGQEVAQELAGEDRRTGTDEADRRHGRSMALPVQTIKKEQSLACFWTDVHRVGHDGAVSPDQEPASDARAARVLVVGDANPDLVLSGDVVPRFGQVEQLLDDASLVIGGSASITAHGLARLGRPVSLAAAVGDDHFGGSSPAGSRRRGSTYATSRSGQTSRPGSRWR